MSLIRPVDAQPAVAQLGEVTRAEPVVVERAGIVLPIHVAEEEVRAADATLGRIQSGPDAHLDTGERPAVVGEPDRFRFVAGPGGAERRFGRSVGPEDDDPVLVLGARQDAGVEHGPAEVDGGERHVGDAAGRRLVHDPVEEEVGTAEERGARLHEEVERGGVVEPVLDGELRTDQRGHRDRLQHPRDRRQRADHEQVVGGGERTRRRCSCASPPASCSASAPRPWGATSCPT